MNVLNRNTFRGKALRAFSLTELLVVLVIIGILVLVAMPNLMPLISRAKATEAQQQLTFLHSLEKSYFYTYSRYSDDLEELGFEQAVSVVDFDKDGVFNVWEIDQDKNLKETVKD